MTGISSLELVHSLELLFEVSRPEEGPGGSRGGQCWVQADPIIAMRIC